MALAVAMLAGYVAMFAYGFKLTAPDPTNFITSAKLALHHPEVVFQIIFEGLPSATPALILGALGAFGGPLGVAVGVGVGSYIVEYQAALSEALRAAGASPGDPEALKLALADQNIMSQAKEYATRLAIPKGSEVTSKMIGSIWLVLLGAALGIWTSRRTRAASRLRGSMAKELHADQSDSLAERVHRILRESDPTSAGPNRSEDIIVGIAVMVVVATILGGFVYTMLSTFGFAPTLIMALVGIACYAIGRR